MLKVVIQLEVQDLVVEVLVQLVVIEDQLQFW